MGTATVSMVTVAEAEKQRAGFLAQLGMEQALASRLAEAGALSEDELILLRHVEELDWLLQK